MSSAPGSSEANKKLVSQLLRRLFSERRVDALDSYLSTDYRELEPFSGQRQGREGFKEFYEDLIEAFPDLRWSLDGQVAEDDRVVSWGSWAGTHGAEFLGIPASNRKARVSVMMVHTVKDGMVTEGLTMADAYGLLQQLGDIPPPGGVRQYRSPR